MKTTGGFIRSDEAGKLIESIKDPVTGILVNNAQYHIYRRLAEKRLPVGEFDLLFYMEVMKEMFSEHELLKRMLAGERVGAFFDEE